MNNDPKIIIIDDEPNVRDSLSEFLEDYGFVTERAGSGEEALEILADRSFHLAIVDLRLPKMSGESFILRAGELYPKMRFIVHTGSVAYGLTAEIAVMRVGPQDIFIKPVTDMNDFVKAIRRLTA